MTPREIDELMRELEPRAEAAYLDEVAATVATVSIARVRQAIERNDEPGLLLAIAAVSGYLAMTEIFRQAFIRAGAVEYARAAATAQRQAAQQSRLYQLLFPGPGSVIEGAAPSLPAGGIPLNPRAAASPAAAARAFDPRTATAAARLASIDARMLREGAELQAQAVRNTIEAGRVAGRTTAQIAADIVGRTTAGGIRSGGVIGLAQAEATYVASARAQLSSGDPAQMRAYLKRTRRDKRFDAAVRKAIATGQSIPSDQVERMAGRYAERLLSSRATMLARSELIERVNAGRAESIRQLAERGLISLDRLTKRWRTQEDEKVRHSHAEMNGQTVPFDQPFMAPSGALLMYPGDQSLGAGWDETANCRCGCDFNL